MSPNLASRDQAYAPHVCIKMGGDLFYGNTASSHRSHLNDLFVVKPRPPMPFAMRWFVFEYIKRVMIILGGRADFKVFQAVIRFNSILVIHLHSLRDFAKKSSDDQAVYEGVELLVAPVKANTGIAPNDGWTQKVPDAGHVPLRSRSNNPYIAGVRNLVALWVPRNWLPRFHNKCLRWPNGIISKPFRWCK